jgi:hypothetical protein
MSLKKINPRTVVLVLMMLVVSLGRLISYEYPHQLSNFTPLGAIALFGGAYFNDKWKAYLVVLITLFLSDIFIDYLYTSKLMLWYDGAMWVYLPFMVMVFFGTFIKKANVLNVILASVGGVCFHWLFSDLPWFYGTRYAHTLVGYGQSLAAAVPFEKNMLLADLLFGLILFGGFEFAKNKYPVLRGHKELAV